MIMNKEFVELMKYYAAVYIVRALEEEKGSNYSNEREVRYEWQIFYVAYDASYIKKPSSWVKPFFQTVKYDNVLDEIQREVLHQLFNAIELDIRLNHEDSIFSRRINFYKDIIQDYEKNNKSSGFDYSRYDQVIGPHCFKTGKYELEYGTLERELLEYYNVQDKKYDIYDPLIYHYEVALQEFFIGLLNYINDDCGMPNQFIIEQYEVLSSKFSEFIEKEKEEIERIKCVGLINNQELIFNLLSRSVSELKYYVNNNRGSAALSVKEHILWRELMACICDTEYIATSYANFYLWTLKYNNRYFYYNGEKILYCDYPAFFVIISNVEKETYWDWDIESINVYKNAKKVLDTVEPFFDSINCDINHVSCAPCFTHADVYQGKAFNMVFNSYEANYNSDENSILNKIEFRFFDY